MLWLKLLSFGSFNRLSPEETISSASAIAVKKAAEATIKSDEPSVRQVVMARQGHPRAPLMTCGDIFRIIIALFIPPLGVFTQVGLTQPFWINLVIYLFAVGGLGFPVLFGMWPVAVIYALFVILTRK